MTDPNAYELEICFLSNEPIPFLKSPSIAYLKKYGLYSMSYKSVSGPNSFVNAPIFYYLTFPFVFYKKVKIMKNNTMMNCFF